MFRTTRLAALGLALAAFAAMDLPASAQGTVREHRGRDTPPAPAPGARDHRTLPPAPTPTVDRDQRRDPPVMRATTPEQWEIRRDAIKGNTEYSIYNLRREQADLSSKLTYRHRGGDLNDTTGWGQDGGDWKFVQDPNARRHEMVSEDEIVALYNTKTKRYLNERKFWDDKPRYMWMVKRQRAVGPTTRFALFNTVSRKWLMTCQNERLEHNNNELLCFYSDNDLRPNR
jgi:hypothetical protein